MANLSNRNCNNPTLFHEIHHFAESNYYIVIMQAINFFSSSFQVDFITLGTKIGFHLNIFFLKRFYLKLLFEELTKENNNKKFHGLSLFLSHVLRSKSNCKLHWTLLINPKKKRKWFEGLALNQVLALNFRFNNLSWELWWWLLAQDYLSE